jgi:FixJ family two-component response regulator
VIAFAVDDHISVREALELLIRHDGWQLETCAIANAILV